MRSAHYRVSERITAALRQKSEHKTVRKNSSQTPISQKTTRSIYNITNRDDSSVENQSGLISFCTGGRTGTSGCWASRQKMWKHSPYCSGAHVLRSSYAMDRGW